MSFKFELIKKRRNHLGISQEGLARVLEKSRRTIVNWEDGNTSPRSDELPALSEALGVKVSDFFGRPARSVGRGG